MKEQVTYDLIPNAPNKSWSHRFRYSVLALLLLAVGAQGMAKKPTEKELFKERLAKAEAMFQERCKTAGEKIYRTVDKVDGIFLLKLRPEGSNHGNQFAMDDPYGSDSGGESYIKTFFSGFYPIPWNPSPVWHRRLGYLYVEAIDPQNNKRYRYTGALREVDVKLSGLSGGGTVRQTRFVLDKFPAPGAPPRYGVTYDDISTHEEREYWIAGSSLKVVDLKNNEVIAERVGYMMDRRQGDRSGGRSPWLLAARIACPAFPADPGGHPLQVDQTREFVLRMLKPVQEK